MRQKLVNLIIKKFKFTIRQVAFSFGQSLPGTLQKFLLNTFVYSPRKAALGIGRGNHTSLFNSVLFEVCTQCNGSCSFCAASVLNETRPKTTMHMSLYSKVINELAKLQFNGIIAYHVNNDPLIFNELPDFVKYARSQLPNAWIEILTNGKALNGELATILLGAGINELSINDYNDDLSAEIPEKIKVIQEKIIPSFYEKHQIRSGRGPDSENRNIFKFNLFRSKATVIKDTRGGTSPNKKIKSKVALGFCEHPFCQLNITTDGRVSMCPADLYFSHPMGNANKQTVTEIWFAEEFQRVRGLLLEGNRERIELCQQCDYYGVTRLYSRAAEKVQIFTSRTLW